MKRYIISAIERRLTSIVLAVFIVAPVYIYSFNVWVGHLSFVCPVQ